METAQFVSTIVALIIAAVATINHGVVTYRSHLRPKLIVAEEVYCLNSVIWVRFYVYNESQITVENVVWSLAKHYSVSEDKWNHVLDRWSKLGFEDSEEAFCTLGDEKLIRRLPPTREETLFTLRVDEELLETPFWILAKVKSSSWRIRGDSRLINLAEKDHTRFID